MPHLAAIDDMATALAKMVLELYKQKGLKPEAINRPVTTQFATLLWQAVKEGFGANFATIDYTTPDFVQLANLQKDVWQFSGAKNYQQLRQLTAALVGDDGKLRSLADFKTAAKKINADYVDRYLPPEYNLAVNGSIMARKWDEIAAQKNTLPLLQFDAVLDTQTTALCASLNNTILPVGHPFWNKYFPPNHYGCRSTVRQLAVGAVTPESKIPTADIPKMFQTNLGKQGLVFPPDHPYFKNIPEGIQKQSLSALRKQIKNETIERLQGKIISVKDVGEVEITATGIGKILSQPISDNHLYQIKNTLVYQADNLLKNAVPVLLNDPDSKGRNFTYDYLDLKGLKTFRLVIRKDIFDGKRTLYSIVNKNAN